MLTLVPIAERVHKGVATPKDTQDLLAEVERLYADLKPASEPAVEVAAEAPVAAEESQKAETTTELDA